MPKPPMQFKVVNDFAGDEVRNFLAYLVQTLGAGENLPIREIFDRIPFGPMGGTTRDDLLARGSIRVRFGGANEEEGRLSNRGDEVFGEFNDEVLGDIAVVFPSRISALYRVNQDSASIDFPNPVEVAVYILPTLSGDLRRSAYQRLTKIVATPERWTYYLHTDGSPDECLALVVNFPEETENTEREVKSEETETDEARSEQKLVEGHGIKSPSKSVRMVARARTRSLCPCCDGQTKIDLRTRWRSPINIHVRRLVNPTAFTVAQYIQAIRDVLTNSGITGNQIAVNLVTDQALNMPTFNQFDVNAPGAAPSAEQQTLFANAGIPAGGFACFIVQTIVSPTNPNITGRGELPGDSFAIEATSPLFTAAHELGHNLGMGHDTVTANAVMNPIAPANNANPVFSQQDINNFLRM